MTLPRRPVRRSPIRDDGTIVTMAWTHQWTPTEAEFTELFIDIARAKGFTHRYHTHDSRRSPEGFPDWVIVNPRQRRTIFAELKGFGGIASEAQRDWLKALADAGSEAYLIGTTGDYALDCANLAELMSARPRR